MKSLRNFAAVVLLSAFAAFPAAASAGWSLVFENDANGATVSGSWSALADAIENGFNVKLVYWRPGDAHRHVVVPNFLSVNRTLQICYATIATTSMAMGDWNSDGILDVATDSLAAGLWRTDGKVEQVNKSWAGVLQSHVLESLPMKWYVER